MNIKVIMRFHNNVPDGGRKIVYEYMNHLAEQGNKVIICFVANTPFKERKYNRLLYAKYYLQYLQKKKKELQIDWFKLDKRVELEVHYSIKESLVSDDDQVLIAFDYGVALSLSEHISNTRKCIYMIQHDEKVYYDEKVVRQAWRLPMKKIVISSWLYKLVNAVDPGNVTLVKNYVNLDAFFLTNPIENRKKVVSLISHPNPYKGTEVGREALDLVKKQVPELRVIMFGTHPAPEDLPDYYNYYQMADEKTLREKIYNQSAIYLLPSVLEGWGLTATEAMACGSALVSTQNGGVEDFGIDNYSALLCKVNDAKDMSEKIIKLLRNTEFRIELANNGHKMVNAMSFSKSVQLFEEVLNRVDQDN